MINNILGLLGNKFFTITFVKKDLSIRTINGRLKVTKYLKGGNCTLDKEKFLIVYSLKDKGYYSRSWDKSNRKFNHIRRSKRNYLL
jgi:hypothetical protein